jgi:predicted dehydrogenase
MIKVGIIGCGKIADQHADSIRRIPDAEIVAVCDTELLMANQLAERYNVKYCFDDIQKFLNLSQMDVIHITTPPQIHHHLGKMCLEAGYHVYMEKPFALNALETEDLLSLAAKKELKITAGHNAQFTHAARYFRTIIKEGFLGGPPVHIESYYCYDFGDEAYAKALLGDDKHWVRQLPGKLLHNIISHGISKIAEFLIDENPKVIANGYTSPMLKRLNEDDIIDELRAIIYDNNNLTAYFTFSSQLSPSLHQLRVYGPKNGIIIDDDYQTVVKLFGKMYKSYLNQFIPPFVYARQYLKNFNRNLRNFIKRDFHNDSGMKYLIEAFYASIRDNLPLPISHKEILLTARIMDEIFSQVNPKDKEVK